MKTAIEILNPYMPCILDKNFSSSEKMEFILKAMEAYKSDCSIVSEAIKESPTEFKEGNRRQWMISHLKGLTTMLYRYDRSEAYMLGNDGSTWETDANDWSEKNLHDIPATPEQTERILSAVAESKGYKASTKIIGISSGQVREITNTPSFQYGYKGDTLVYGFITIYNSGTWAKIVDQDKPETKATCFEGFTEKSQPTIMEKQEISIEDKDVIEKPPIGLKPNWLHNEQRMAAILQCFNRYFEVKKEIPEEWICEFKDLNKAIQKQKAFKEELSKLSNKS